MNKKKESKVVPNVRFKGFTDDWEQRKLGELAEIVGGGTPSTSVESYWDGDIDWYAPAEIGEQIYLKSSQRKITEEGLNKSSAKVLPVGTVLFTSRAGIGKTAILLKEGCTNQGFQSIVPNKNKLDSYFIFTRSEELKRYGETVGAGSTFVEVSGKQMANMELMMPTTMDEQQKIGEYLSNLDNLITLHQQKITLLTKLKKAMLEKMFPKKGTVIPEFRFNGFANAWEQRKLSDVVDSVDTGKSKFDKEGSSGEYPILGSTSVIGYDDEYDYEGDFILTARVGANAGSLYRHAGKVKISDNTVFIQASQNIEFLYQLLIRFDIKRLSFGTGQPLVKASELKRLELMMPTNMEEQMRIGVYFKNLDHLITLHQRKIDKIKNMKKAMLDQMFI